MVTLTYQERFKTLKGVFDEFTNRNLFKLQSQGAFDELVGPLKVGKESNVFLAKKGTTIIIVKIYRIQNADYKRMFDYIRKDSRYQFLRQKRREIIFAWAQREYKNLLKAEKCKINSPKPLGWKMNIIVEEMIGSPAPPLKDATPSDPEEFFHLIVEQMKILYQGGLIHGDLSSFNILNHEEQPFLIDFSQSTLVGTPNSEELLRRDIKNIVRYFSKLGLDKEENDIFEEITS